MRDAIHVSTRKGLFTLRRNGRWDIAESAFVGDNVTLAMRDPRNGYEYAALDHGHFGVKLHRRKPGEAWQEITTPAFPPQPEGRVDHDGWGRVLPWTVMRVWALEPGGPDQPGLIWCGTIPGALFRSDDHGETWRWMQNLWDDPRRAKWMGGGADWPGIHSVCVDPRDSKTVRFGVSCGGVWTTRDAGETWELTADGMRAEYAPPDRVGEPESQDAHFLVQSPSHPDRLWVQHHNGIFRSDDGSMSWKEIHPVEPSAFGFAVAVHPREPDTAWFVPGIKDELRYPVDAALVVTRTRDAGKSFDILRNGLPQRHAYDIVYRHALTIDESGDRLAFGSTTGGVWLTEDQGEHWSELGYRLPPVHAVRFG